MAQKRRAVFEIHSNKMSELIRLAELTGCENIKELFNNTLTLLQWSIEESRQECDIGAYHRTNRDLHIAYLYYPAVAKPTT